MVRMHDTTRSDPPHGERIAELEQALRNAVAMMIAYSDGESDLEATIAEAKRVLDGAPTHPR